MRLEHSKHDPLPLDRPPVKTKQAHVEHTGPLGSPVLETKLTPPVCAYCGHHGRRPAKVGTRMVPFHLCCQWMLGDATVEPPAPAPPDPQISLWDTGLQAWESTHDPAEGL